MEKLMAGDMATLSDGKQFIVFAQTMYNGGDYVYLMSNFKPVEIMFARQVVNGNNLDLQVVTDQEEKKVLLKVFLQENKIKK